MVETGTGAMSAERRGKAGEDATRCPRGGKREITIFGNIRSQIDVKRRHSHR